MTMTSFKCCGFYTALSLAVTVSPVYAGVTDKDILADQETIEDVVTYGLGLRGQRYSPMDTINRETVKDIRPVWAFSLGGKNNVARKASRW